jgi:hypothetical protein
MSGFFDRRKLDAEFEQLLAFLTDFYGNDDSTRYNLEDVLAFLELSKSRLRTWCMEPMLAQSDSLRDYEKLYEDVLRYTQLALQIPDGKSCKMHENLFRRLQPEDSVVTLNYDLIADQTFEAMCVSESTETAQFKHRLESFVGLLSLDDFWGVQPLTREVDDTGLFLKLHGSLDWLRCPNANCRNHEHIVSTAHKLPERELHNHKPGSPCRICGAGIEQVLLPPATSKRLDDLGRFPFLWNLALRRLRAARAIVVFGVSLAPTDFELRWLLKEGVNPAGGAVSISIINPDKNAEDAFRKWLPIPNIVRYGSVVEFLNVNGSESTA